MRHSIVSSSLCVLTTGVRGVMSRQPPVGHGNYAYMTPFNHAIFPLVHMGTLTWKHKHT